MPDLAVRAVDRSDREQLAISEISWDGRVLRFASLMPSTHQHLEHELRPLDESHVEHAFTEHLRWVRVG